MNVQAKCRIVCSLNPSSSLCLCRLSCWTLSSEKDLDQPLFSFILSSALSIGGKFLPLPAKLSPTRVTCRVEEKTGSRFSADCRRTASVGAVYKPSLGSLHPPTDQLLYFHFSLPHQRVTQDVSCAAAAVRCGAVRCGEGRCGARTPLHLSSLLSKRSATSSFPLNPVI